MRKWMNATNVLNHSSLCILRMNLFARFLHEAHCLHHNIHIYSKKMILLNSSSIATVFIPNDDLNDLNECNHLGMQNMAKQSVTKTVTRYIEQAMIQNYIYGILLKMCHVEFSPVLITKMHCVL